MENKIILEQLVEEGFEKYRKHVEFFEKESTIKQSRDLQLEDYGNFVEILRRQDEINKIIESKTDLNISPDVILGVVTNVYTKSILPIISQTQTIPEEKGVVYYREISYKDKLLNSTQKPYGGTIPYTDISTKRVNVELAEGDGSTTQFTFQIDPFYIDTLTIWTNDDKAYGKDFQSEILGRGIKSGNVDYKKGIINIEFSKAPEQGVKILANYVVDLESKDEIEENVIEDSFKTMFVSTSPKILQGTMSFIKRYTMKKRFGLDAEKLLAQEMKREWEKTMLREYLNTIEANAYLQYEWDSTRPDGISLYQHYQSLELILDKIDAQLLQDRDVMVDKIYILGYKALPYIKQLQGFVGYSNAEKIMGAGIVGTLNGSLVIIDNNLNNEVYIVAKGNDPFSHTVFNAVYMPLTSIDFVPNYKNILKSKNALVSINDFIVVNPTIAKLTIK